MSKKWVSVWGNAVSPLENKPEMYAKDITLRYPILMPLDGNKIRFRFDNFAGTEAVTINKVTVAKYRENHLIEGTIKTVLFDGKESFTLDSQENLFSDELEIDITKGETIALSFYLKDYTLMKSGVTTWGPLSKAVYAVGDHTESIVLPAESSREIINFYFLNQVDVYCDERCSSIICYGDSITAQSWPELLVLKLMETNQNKAVVRRGVSGSRVLRQYNALSYEHYGIKGDVRFRHEIKTAGVDTVIILQGINDLIHPVGTDVNPFRPWSDLPTSQQLIEGLQVFIKLAKEEKLKVIIGTILPVKGWRTYQDFRNTLREEVNQWIRTTDEIDAYIDFDEVMKNPEDTAALLPEYDSGDHLHPNDRGHQRMMEEVMKVLNNM